MDVTLPILILFGIAAAWTALAFLPAVRELRERRDTDPIPIVRDSEMETERFADGLRRFLAEKLSAARARCRSSGQRQTGRLEDGTEFLVLPGTEAADTPLDADCPEPAHTLIDSCGALRLPPYREYLQEACAAGPIHGGEGNAYRALLSEDSIHLGARSASYRWLHAEKDLAVGPSSRLFGRVSAGGEIRLDPGCRFERLHAPRIRFGQPLLLNTPPPDGPPVEPSELSRTVDVAGGRWLVAGDLRIPGERIVPSSLVATGSAEIGTGARIHGSVKAHGDLTLGEGVEVFGSLVAGRDLEMGAGCRVHGPVLAEGTFRAAAAGRIGSPEDPTTVSARIVDIEPGVVCHGTVWAHGEGRTGAEDPEALPAHDLQRLEPLRYRGCQGGFISRHRALLFSPCDAGKIGGVALLTVAALAVWGMLLGPVARLWEGMMGFYGSVFGVAVSSGMAHYRLGGIGFDIPVLIVPAGLPSPFLWWTGALLMLVLLGVSYLLPDRHLPSSIALRVLAFFQATAQAFFAVWPEAFPYTATGYLHTMLIAGLMLLTLVPVVLAFTYYLFDFGWLRKVALTAAILAHLAVMIPLQYAVHAFVLYHGSLLFLPLLFFVFGLPLNVFVFIALYSWGFSWRNRLHDQDVQWKARGRFV